MYIGGKESHQIRSLVNFNSIQAILIRKILGPQKYEPIGKGLKLTIWDGTVEMNPVFGLTPLSTACWCNDLSLTGALYNFKYSSVYACVDSMWKTGVSRKVETKKPNRYNTEVEDI